ncbi:hypothetical protein TCAL_11211 [Tigriopus californicus]|uniref:Uncharacterized protein n=1 Tax=Tigriopus californicus TaxID=6832 RepID=A0A553PB05_TIGCA|nr:RAB11-binding protein RELCH-like [Tigriopus californicus]TRY74860.1 hypothetical protein TCAL_11211 [Tigriopus californicus]|eukprot:TCALIF_11211-PA protein Name:"Similar to Kiaa1468 LisH domain and HEAT repeat-containing protein KIAA1468 (Mus musculus)" AED:0.01 eAED:0.01 QI:114/1/1/1/1/1/3/114/1081
MNYQSVADQLLSSGLLLTALELHVELAERGKELTSLKKFFENPSNFEKYTRKFSVPPSPCPSQASIEGFKHRRGSQATLDSTSLFELTRFSEDSRAQTEDRLAVLEFELRKARETIHSLRSQLTDQAAKLQDSFHPQADVPGGGESAKLSLISDLVEDPEDDEIPAIRSHERRTINYLVNEYLLQQGCKLTSITFSDENSEEDFEDWDSVGLNVAKPPSLLRLFRDFGQHVVPEKDQTEQSCQTDEPWIDNAEISRLEGQNQALETECQVLRVARDELSEKLSDHQKLQDQSEMKIKKLQLDHQCLEELIETLKANRSSEPSGNANEEDQPSSVAIEDMDVDLSPRFPISVALFQLLSHRCHIRNQPSSQETLTKMSEADALDTVLQLLATSLPNIVPNVILAKRDELIPLLLITIQMHPESKIRDHFLNLLFNLIKRPEAPQREMIIHGFQAMAQKSGPARIESELLPQCWEQIGHKYEERRILVAETCGQLMPFIPANLRVSLLLSMLQQMALEDREVQVRCSAIRSLAFLVIYLDSDEKFDSLWQLTSTLLKETHLEVIHVTHETLLPAMAHLGTALNLLHSAIARESIHLLIKHTDLAEDWSSYQAIHIQLTTLSVLLPFVIHSVISSAPKLQKEKRQDHSIDPVQPKDLCVSNTLQVFYQDETSMASVIQAFQDLVGCEWYERWSEMNWFLDAFLTPFFQALAKIPVPSESHDFEDAILKPAIEFVSQLIESFGRDFGLMSLLPLIERQQEQNPPHHMDNVLKAVIAVAILRPCQSQEVFVATLKQWLILHLQESHPTNSILFAIKSTLNESRNFGVSIAEMAWTLVTDQDRALRNFSGRIFEALVVEVIEDDDLIGNRILPGLVTLSSDPDELIRISALPGLGVIMAGSMDALREKAAFQFLVSLEEGESAIVFLAVLAVLGHVWKDLPMKMREETILYRVAHIFSKFCSLDQDAGSLSRVSDICLSLLQLYEIVSDQTLSANSVHQILLPNLDLLSKCMESVVPTAQDRVHAIEAKLESIYGVGHANQNGESRLPTGSNAATKMVQSPSLDEMKHKMGKLFNKPGGPVPFWKKS